MTSLDRNIFATNALAVLSCTGRSYLFDCIVLVDKRFGIPCDLPHPNQINIRGRNRGGCRLGRFLHRDGFEAGICLLFIELTNFSHVPSLAKFCRPLVLRRTMYHAYSCPIVV